MINYKKNTFTIVTILLFLFLFLINTSDCKAALKIKYNNKSQKYSGKQIKTYLDGKTVKTDGTKALIFNKTIMGSYKDIFKKACGATTKYDSKTGKITIKANGTTVKLKLGSKTITVNGKKKKTAQAPVKIRYVKKKKTKILVPVKIVAKALGYTYIYNKTENNINLITPFVLYYNNKYKIYKSYFGGLVYDNTTIDISDMPVMKINGSVMIPGNLIFTNTLGINYSYDSTNGNIIISNDFYNVSLNTGSNILTVTNLADNVITEYTMKTTPLQVTYKNTGYTDVMIPAASIIPALGYNYKWDSTMKICNIHSLKYFHWKEDNITYDNSLYTNALKEFSTGYDLTNNAIVLSLSFVNDINEEAFVITDDSLNNLLYIDFAGALNLLANRSYTMTGKNINTIISEQSTTGTRIYMSLYNNISYYHSISANTLNIYITEGWKTDYGLRITKPAELLFEQFSLEDRYYENKFIISMPGDYTQYFTTYPIIKTSANITSYDVLYDAVLNVTTINVITSKLQGCKLVNLGNIIGVIVDDPQNVFENIVVLDPGHGGKDPGAQKNGVNESDLNYTILYTYAKEYFNSPQSTVKAYWTRVDDTYLTLDERAKFAYKVNADMFVSLHMNSATNSSAKGTEVFYCATNNATNSFGLNSNLLATKCLSKITPALQTAVRGVKTANYYVIKYNSVPAVLIELGFMTNTNDFKILTSQTHQQSAAKAIYEAVAESFIR